MAKQTEQLYILSNMFRFQPGLSVFIFVISFMHFGFKGVDSQKAGDLILEFENLKNKKGKILILLFPTKEGFPGETAHSSYSASLEPAQNHVIKNIPFGNYALSLVHDEDNDGKMNVNFLGIPKEGYSFSNSKGKMLERPNFEKSVFQHNKPETRLRLRFIY